MRAIRRLLLPVLLSAIMCQSLGADGPPVAPNARPLGLSSRPPAVPNVQRVGASRFSKIPGSLYRHRDASISAAADIFTLSKIKRPEELRYMRYLTVHNLPPDMRLEGLKLSSFLLNSLSRSDMLVVPAVGGPDNILIRVNLFDYGIDPKTWDRLCEREPYFHQKIVEETSITKIINGKTIVEKKPGGVKIAAAGWCDPNSMATLISLTQSTAPIVRADWFIVNFSDAQAYYDILKFKTLNDYLDFVAFDKRALLREARATIVTSGKDGHCPRVAENNRILSRVPSLNGYIWSTFDFADSVGANNVINNPLQTKRAAGEYIASGLNGLQYYFLVNEKDARINEGDIKIVRDDLFPDRRVINGRSCIACHAKGINEFTSHFQLQIGYRRDQSDLSIFDRDIGKSLELSQFLKRVFGYPNFSDIIATDQRLYDNAVKATNGLSAEENAGLFRTHWNSYVNEQLDMPRLIYELGYNEQEIRAALPLRLDGIDDGVLLQQLLVPPVAIRREHWEEVFSRISLKLLLIKK